MTDTPTLADYEAAQAENKEWLAEVLKIQEGSFALSGIEKFRTEKMIDRFKTIDSALTITIRALKAKEGGAKMLGVEPVGEMALRGLVAFSAEVSKTNGPCENDGRYSEQEMKELSAMRSGRQLHNSKETNAAFKAMHNAAECLIEGEKP